MVNNKRRCPPYPAFSHGKIVISIMDGAGATHYIHLEDFRFRRGGGPRSVEGPMRNLRGCFLGILAAALALSLAVRGQEPSGEAKTTPVMREMGEPEGDAFHFPPIAVDPRVYQMNDPMISNLARA